MRIFLSVMLIAGFLFGAETVYFTPKKILELKSHPREQAETLLMIKEGVLLIVKSVMADSAGREWYMVKLPKENLEGFVVSDGIEMLGDEAKSKIYLKVTNEESEDKKRRLTEIHNHPEWSRRVKSVVHGGAICLKMTTEQLYASWQKPYYSTTGFILGLGDVEIFFYREANPVAVVVKNNEVMGWSEKGK